MLAQSTYYRFLKLQLVLLLVVSVISMLLAVIPPDRLQDASLVIGVILLVNVVLSLIMRVRQYEKTWFDCRAIAESVKTVAWRYGMRARPFDMDAAGADRTFIESLAEIRATWPGLERHIQTAGTGSELPQTITDMRLRSLHERRTAYVTDRLREQKAWYTTKCALNRTRSHQWFWSVTSLQGIAVLVALLQARYGVAPVNVIALFTTAAAAAVAWTQARRHDELVQSYALAAHELRSLDAIADSVNNEELFRDFVDQVEGAISREHTMWCARRDVRLPRR